MAFLVIYKNKLEKFSLYVGYLDSSVEESDLFNKFNVIGEVSSIRICRDRISGSSLGYAYINFNYSSHAEKAMKELNFVEMKGKPMRIMFSNRDPSIRRSGKGNVFIKNLHKSFDSKQLGHSFSSFGTILSCKVACDSSGISKEYGFVQFDSKDSLTHAIRLNGSFVRGQYLHVCPFVTSLQWDESPDLTNIYAAVTEDDLKRIFGEFGEITSAVVMRDAKGKSRKFGFVNFEKIEAAVTAKKNNRVENLKSTFKFEKFKGDVRVLKRLNLYVKNLDDSVDDEKLQTLFSEFGTINSCKVMVHLNGKSKCVGFVEFSTSEEAYEVKLIANSIFFFFLQMLKMTGKLVEKKPIYVSLALRKEERPLLVQSSFSLRPSLHQHHIFSQAVTPMTTMLPPQLPLFRGYNVRPQFMFGSSFLNGYTAMNVPNYMVPQQYPSVGLHNRYFSYS
ncbi:hypothetical protein N665_0594s0011 [Sinapis alba]|nr:hypothetical protein N665_0594s0011 [Sinapis alba]